MIWKALTKIALLGTDRAKLSEALLTELAAQGVDNEQDSAKIVLEASAIYTQMQRAGFALPDYEKDLPIDADDADAAVVSENSAHHLSLILKGQFRLALPEYMAHLAKNKKQLPPELLPNMLSNYQARGATWASISPVVGKRGEWLVRQHPRWQHWLPPEDFGLWETGTFDQRLAIIRALRQENAAAVLPLLEATWAKERHEHRAQFLTIFEVNLSQLDEPFLEKCLDDGRQEVRILAARILAQLPQTAYAKRMGKRLANYLKLEGEKLKVTLPEAPTAAERRDGISGKMTNAAQGLRAAWLEQYVAGTNPIQLQALFPKKTRTEILELMLETDFQLPLLRGVFQGILMSKREDWLLDYFPFWAKQENLINWTEKEMEAITDLLSEGNYNQLIINLLTSHSVVEKTSPIGAVLNAKILPLNQEISLQIGQQFQTYVNTSSNTFGSHFQEQNSLKQFAYACSIEALPFLKKGWNYSSPIWGVWEQPVEEFIRTLQFRKTMREGLEV